MRIQARNLHSERKWKPFLSSSLVQTFHIIVNISKIEECLLVGIAAIIDHQPDIYLKK